MKKILLFSIGVLFSIGFHCQNLGTEMGKFEGVAAYYNPSGYISNTYNYLNEVNTGMK
ncbi:MAG: hypothetical protein VB102_04045 [Paludibacter sp.]|nr:hypothetical protein [Paludibacter sp.]